MGMGGTSSYVDVCYDQANVELDVYPVQRGYEIVNGTSVGVVLHVV